MPYADLDDATDLYGEDYVLSSVDRDDDGNPDVEALRAALGQASSEMDSYLGVRFTVPIAPVPQLLVRYCVDIAIYQLAPDAGSYTDEKRRRYEDAIRWLQAVAAGKAALPVTPPTEDTQQPVPEMVSSTRLFTRTKLGGVL